MMKPRLLTSIVFLFSVLFVIHSSDLKQPLHAGKERTYEVASMKEAERKRLERELVERAKALHQTDPISSESLDQIFGGLSGGDEALEAKVAFRARLKEMMLRELERIQDEYQSSQMQELAKTLEQRLIENIETLEW